MEIITWNVQAGLGIDNQIDCTRIANDLKNMGSADVICLQEIPRRSDRTTSSTQYEFTGLADELWNYFPGYEMYYAPAVDRLDSGGRYQFGNMILSRLEVDTVFIHKLPQPSDPSVRNMPRQAIEIIVNYNQLPLRIITTHLEYFATEQRTAQLEYLKKYHLECCDRFQFRSPGGVGSYAPPSETDRTIICGDFNLVVDTEHYCSMTEEVPVFGDAWRVVHGDKEHAPTCGIYDLEQWPDGEHCRDFFFLSEPLISRVDNISVDTETQSSDHQPVKLTLR